MGLGVLEPNTSLEHVPGTALLQDAIPTETAHLKKGTGHDTDVVLVPQPSNSQNDPLNWPLWQRDLILVLFCYLTNICVGAIGPLIGVLALDMVQAFHIDFQKVTLLSGYQLALVGSIAPLVAALSHKYGKRPWFLTSMVFLLAGTIWCAEATSYDSMIGGRLIQGVGTAIFESVTFTLIGDLYFVHQRGSRMAIYVVAQVALVLLPSLLTGVVSVNLGWRWCFWLLAIFLGIGLVLIILFGWETAYNRNQLYDVDTSSRDNIHVIEELRSGKTVDEAGVAAHLERTISSDTGGSVMRDSFLKRMKPWSTTYSNESLIQLIFRPFYILLNPVILWAVLLISFFQLWNVVINFMLGQLFGPPPYLLNTAQLGYIGAGPMVFGSITCLLFGALSDRIAKKASTRNDGIYEPEFRLMTMGLAPILSTIGYFCFGPFAAEGKSPVIMSVLWGIGFASCVVVTASLGSYLVDAYRNVSIEVFVVSMSVKNFMFFGFSFFLNEWLAKWGPEKVFNTIGGISLAFCATTIIVYMYGKKVRAWWHKHDIFDKLERHK
ncbi:uncharacterized protein A1O5_12534 [Cladophialophora psammophila CBS 110553]|uniref:Major facilitator superfamily (MFS) profile domain-containing protein n=1 Tax=Cladophialophora psammophila CBS 110553 TaxID=1182543 RepID=W9WGV5_9EURO|nr:uncharacterized protein A1O5_12534 [Cladophialophora psammophila CBS 110553]EXJ57744.1 hypothetical protein A1O5_12534 [Cladophialophora psammophila CBS 110553]